jgi:uncharacterized membrane protein YsdA (DUF1294 family)
LQLNAEKKPRKANNGVFIGIVSVIFIFYLLTTVIAGHLQPIALWIYVAASIISFVAYYIDKNAAKHGGWRIQENTLHIMALLGGWPGAYAAQRIIRHKTIKEPFQNVFVVSVILNIVGFILYSSSTASNYLFNLLI